MEVDIRGGLGLSEAEIKVLGEESLQYAGCQLSPGQ
jgi:hypothetical protein